MAHLKREQTPKSWPIERKGTTYIVRPSYNLSSGVPVLLIIRDLLKLGRTRREVRKAINAGQILLNHRKVSDEAESASLFDILTIVPPKGSQLKAKNYKVIIGKNKRFNVDEVSDADAERKIIKIADKKTLKGKKIQINLMDGRNFISDMKCRVNDSVVVNLKDKKLEKCLPLKAGSKAIVFAGKHAGEEGKIAELEEGNNMVKFESDGKVTNILIKQLMTLE